MRGSDRKLRLKKSLTKAPIYIFLLIACFFSLGPIYVVLANAFKTRQQSTENFFAPPRAFYLENLTQVVQRDGYFNYVRNTVVITACALLALAVLLPMVSYALARNMHRSIWYRRAYFYFILGVFVPFQVVMIPVVKMMSQIGLSNIPGLILMHIVFAFSDGIFLFVAYMQGLPIELEEAARIDGCSVMQTYLRIVFPLAAPMLAAVLSLNCLWIWNDFLLPLLLLNKSPDSWTLQLFQYNFKTTYSFDYNQAFASVLIATLPVAAVYLAAQRFIVSGITGGAVKG